MGETMKLHQVSWEKKLNNDEKQKAVKYQLNRQVSYDIIMLKSLQVQNQSYNRVITKTDTKELILVEEEMRVPMPNTLNKKANSQKGSIIGLSNGINPGTGVPKKGRRKSGDGEVKGKPWTDFSKENKYRETDKPGKRGESQPVVTPVILARAHKDVPSSSKLRENVQRKDLEKMPAKPFQIASKPMEALLVPERNMKKAVKIMDESLSWSDEFAPYLLEQSNFMVVSVVGLQGVGKSTICSYLANGSSSLNILNPVTFKAQQEDDILQSAHCTHGIEAYITNDRMIILDLQPLLSPSIMEYLVSQERKTSSDFNSLENLLEIESLQLLTMAMSVSHAMVMVQDFILQPNLLQMLHTCQMLKPAHNSSGGGGRDVGRRNFTFSPPYYPHLVFVHNRAQPHEFEPRVVSELQAIYQMAMADSSFYVESQIGITTGTFSPTLNTNMTSHLNLFLLPDVGVEHECPISLEESIMEMRRQLFSLTRSPITPTPMTEKSWYQFSGKMWDTIRKSNLFHEYCKLLP